jgi:general secretion pathway protein K
VNDDKGMALLMTLLVVAMLSVLVLAMNTRSLLAVTRAKQSVDALNAAYIMRSGISAAMAFLERDARESTIDALSEVWAQDVTQFPVGDGMVSIRIEDEASKFNINTLVTPQRKIDDKAVERFGRLLKTVGNDDGLAQRVAEWLRSQRADPSYTFRDPSELLLVPGLTVEAFKRVENSLTVYTDPVNSRNINVNTAGRDVLVALSPKLSGALIDGILNRRIENPFREIGDVKKVSGMNDEILYTFSDAIDVKSSTFRVRAEAKVADVVKRGSAFVSRDGGSVRVIAWKEE